MAVRVNHLRGFRLNSVTSSVIFRRNNLLAIAAKLVYSPLKCKGLRNFLPSQIQNDNFEFIAAHRGSDPILVENQLIKFDDVILPSKMLDNGHFRAPIQGLYRFEIQVKYMLKLMIIVISVVN